MHKIFGTIQRKLAIEKQIPKFCNEQTFSVRIFVGFEIDPTRCTKCGSYFYVRKKEEERIQSVGDRFCVNGSGTTKICEK